MDQRKAHHPLRTTAVVSAALPALGRGAGSAALVADSAQGLWWLGARRRSDHEACNRDTQGGPRVTAAWYVWTVTRIYMSHLDGLRTARFRHPWHYQVRRPGSTS